MVNKALILAAGLGTRLSPMTNDRPKSLVEVNGTPILFKQIDNLLKNGIDDITIVSGYKAEFLEKQVQKNYPMVNVVESREYETTNNMYSAYIGIKSMFPDNKISPFYMMNADVFYDASVITKMVNDSMANIIVVDIGRYIDESMKVIVSNGRVEAISKQITPDKAFGCSIDVYRFGEDGGEAFFNKCLEYIEQKNVRNKWSEVALNEILDEVMFCVCPLDGRWVEIDNFDDLKEAEALFK